MAGKPDKEKVQLTVKTESGQSVRSNHGTVAPAVVPEGWLWLGQIGRPHGVRGAFFLKSQDNRSDWPGYEAVFVGAQAERPVRVEKAYLSGGKLALQLEGISSREQCESLYNAYLFVSREQIDLGDSEYLVVDIVGSQVHVEGRDGVFGEVIAVHDFGAQETLEIKPTVATRGTVFFPFTEHFVLDFDPAGRTILIKNEPVFLDEGN